ncbi:hypothetical protein [Pseudomonas fluorescens]|uniref:Uncharacterized protein n=1 Tax=Pseudomonas fluorescens TaxID=294 RepID=A0A5E7EU70_PSEFL|nr:hypothetical protein [Pseudomonas fluorescens]VVO30376.1 hypothetical protein PS723_04940 [Pseudomonas fluorescens]
MDELFCIATGSLYWSPRDAWETPVPQILMAWEARVEFLRATNPSGPPPAPPGPPAHETADEKRQRIKDQMRSRKES